MDVRSIRSRGVRRSLLLVSVLALVAGACGGDGETSDGGGAVAVDGQDGLTIVMDEYSYAPETLTVTAGEEVVLTIINEGDEEHELMIGLPVGGGPEWETDLFARMAPEVISGEEYHLEGFEGMEEGEHEEEEGHEEGAMAHGAEVEVEARGEVTLRLHIPEDAVGEWEIACYLTNHYESGMKGTLIVQ